MFSLRKNILRSICFVMLCEYLNADIPPDLRNLIESIETPIIPKGNGLYKVEARSFFRCAGPKKRNATISQIEMSTNKSDQYVKFQVDVLNNIGPIGGELFVYHFLNNTTINTLFSYRMPNICRNFYIRFFINYMKPTENCVFKQNTFEMKIYFDRDIHRALGEKFVYGRVGVTAKFYSKSSNFLCVICIFDFIPLTA